MNSAYQSALPVKLAIFDIDGVMTDGSLFFDEEGREYKAFNSLDGHGLKMLKQTGIELAIITGRESQVVVHRAKNLGISYVYQGAGEKLLAYRHLLAKLGLQPEQTAYMGDDVVDLPVLTRCGLAISVPSAPEEVQQYAHMVTRREGGHGAVREACEFIMKAQGNYAALLAEYVRTR